jgi:hypothetical protein
VTTNTWETAYQEHRDLAYIAAAQELKESWVAEGAKRHDEAIAHATIAQALYLEVIARELGRITDRMS